MLARGCQSNVQKPPWREKIIPRFTSIDWQRVEGRGDCVTVLCDQDRPQGLAFVIDQTIDVDGALYMVLDAEHPHLAGPLRKGEQVVLWIIR